MIVSVERIVRNEGSVTVAEGVVITKSSGEIPLLGETVQFAGDWRPMQDIAEALDFGEYVQVTLEPWQLLGVAR